MAAKGINLYAYDESLANQLMLSPMVENNTDNHKTATVSIGIIKKRPFLQRKED